MEMINWGWPQYLVASWWVVFFFIALGANIVKGNTESWGKFIGRHIGVAIFAFILYFGGFWA